jgi:hypothetical protein
MIGKRLIKVGAAGLLLLLLLAGAGYAQGQATTGPKATETASLETVKGTIDYNERLGGYFIRGEEPGGEFFIVNQNPKILKKLKDNGKSVKIEGRTVTEKGAEYFRIEKIDGKKYTGRSAKQ